MKINILREISEVFEKFWLFLTVALALKMVSYLATADVNAGVDGTGAFKWKSYEGWVNIVTNSRYLNEEAKVRNLEIEKKKLVDEKSQLNSVDTKVLP